MILVDLDGEWPSWEDVTSTVKKGAKWIGDHKEDIAKASIAFVGAAAATALTVSTFGVGAGAVVAIAATAGGTIGMVSSDQNGGNALDGFSRGMLVGTVGP